MRKIAIFIFLAMHKNAECINVLVLTPNFFCFGQRDGIPP